MSNQRRKRIHRDSGSLSGMPEKYSINNPGRLRIVQSEQTWSVYREANKDTSIADSIYAINFASKPFNRIKLFNGSDNLNLQSEEDYIQMLNDLCQSVDLLKELQVPDKEYTSWEVIRLVEQKLIEKYGSEYWSRIELHKGTEFYLTLVENHGLDGFYWIEIPWLIGLCNGAPALEDLVYQAIYLLCDVCKIPNLLHGDDEMYVEYCICQLEECLIDEREELQEDIDCYNEGDYSVYVNKIDSYKGITLKQFHYNVLDIPYPIRKHKICQWLLQVEELISTKFNLLYWDDDSEDSYNNGEIRIDSCIRFIYHKYGVLSGITHHVEDDANNQGVAGFTFKEILRSGVSKITVPKSIDLLKNVMNFQNY